MVSSTQRVCIILDTKYENSDLNKVMIKQCQHLEIEEHDRLLALLRNYEGLFNGILVMCSTKPVDLELKDDVIPVFSRPYPVPILYKTVLRKEV